MSRFETLDVSLFDIHTRVEYLSEVIGSLNAEVESSKDVLFVNEVNNYKQQIINCIVYTRADINRLCVALKCYSGDHKAVSETLIDDFISVKIHEIVNKLQSIEDCKIKGNIANKKIKSETDKPKNDPTIGTVIDSCNYLLMTSKELFDKCKISIMCLSNYSARH